MAQSEQLEQRLLEQIERIRIIDVHSHVPAAEPFARSLRDLLGYHYYTELAHSAGMSKEVIAPDRPDEEMIPELLRAMEAIDNTGQYRWLVELAQELFGFEHRRLTADNWQPLARAVRRAADQPDRAAAVMDASNIEKVFLTNSPDEDLDGIDTELFVPCLRADDLVFRMEQPPVREGLESVTNVALTDGDDLRRALAELVDRFRAHGAASVAISLPPGFGAEPVADSTLDTIVGRMLRGSLAPQDAAVLHSGVLFALTAQCAEHALPFQVMCGALREAYPHGVHQGRDLPVAGDTLRGLLPLLNAFPEVTFCLSVLSDSQIQELGAYGWILQNVVLSGHWWYLNVPEHIARDLTARLQSVPKAKLIGYYSDMYKLEFGLAKFGMYRRVLARVLAHEFVARGYGTEQEALQIARLLLRDNALRIFSLEDD
ncbi:MAG: glucuronate isomerase [Candidatus Brocadiia bacterium]